MFFFFFRSLYRRSYGKLCIARAIADETAGREMGVSKGSPAAFHLNVASPSQSQNPDACHQIWDSIKLRFHCREASYQQVLFSKTGFLFPSSPSSCPGVQPWSPPCPGTFLVCCRWVHTHLRPQAGTPPFSSTLTLGEQLCQPLPLQQPTVAFWFLKYEGRKKNKKEKKKAIHSNC